MSFYGQTIKNLKDSFFSSFRLFNYKNFIKNSYPTNRPSLGTEPWLLNGKTAKENELFIPENNVLEIRDYYTPPAGEEFCDLKQILPNIINGTVYYIMGQIRIAPNSTVHVITASYIHRFKNDTAEPVWKDINAKFTGSVIKNGEEYEYDYLMFRSQDPFAIKNIHIVEEEYIIDANSVNDNITFEAGRNITFKHLNPQDSTIIIEHDKANPEENNPIIEFKENTSEGLDISNNQTVTFLSKNYDNLGHVNKNSTSNTLSFNIDTAQNKRKELEATTNDYHGLIDNLRDAEESSVPINDFSLYDYIKSKIIKQVDTKVSSYVLGGTISDADQILHLDITVEGE